MVRKCRGIPGAVTAPRLSRETKAVLHSRGPAWGAHGVSRVSPRASFMNFVKIGNARRPVENGQ